MLLVNKEELSKCLKTLKSNALRVLAVVFTVWSLLLIYHLQTETLVAQEAQTVNEKEVTEVPKKIVTEPSEKDPIKVTSNVSKKITLQDVMDYGTPVFKVLAFPFYVVALFWSYINENPGTGIIFSVLFGAVYTFFTIRNHRATIRLRETFAMINHDNWDEDVIKARQTFGRIKEELAKNGESITKYCKPTLSDKKADLKQKENAEKKSKQVTPPVVQVLVDDPDAIDKAEKQFKRDLKEKAKKVKKKAKKTEKKSRKAKKKSSKRYLKEKVALDTILNDYENLALGVRYDIIDELYLYRWIRSSLIADYNTLHPMIIELRQLGNDHKPLLYIEFEGLANAWGKNESYCAPGKTLKKADRKTSIS